MEMDVEAYLRRRYEGQIADIEIIQKEDLDLVSHLIFISSLSLCNMIKLLCQLRDIMKSYLK